MVRRYLPFLFLAIFGVLLVVRSGDGATDQLGGRVVRVVDGDTIHVRLDSGPKEKVRLIGIDTPEPSQDECYAAEATKEAKRLLDGRRVRLSLDAEERDRYGRLLAYVRRGELFVNERLVRRGYATPLTIPPNVRHAERFARAARRAREERKGLWSAC